MKIMTSVVLGRGGDKECEVRPLADGALFVQLHDKRDRSHAISSVSMHMSPAEARAVGQEIARADMMATDSFPHPMLMNAREQIKAVEDMLSFCDERLSMGLRSPEDAIRLWRAWSRHAEDTHPDQWDTEDFMTVLGYSPFQDALPMEHQAAAEVE